MKKNKLILHIPHSSKKLPQKFWENVIVDKNVVTHFVDAITDINTNKLFGSNLYKKIIFPYSRVFCDVEKFENDLDEPLSKFGMGVVYTKTNKGRKFAQVSSEYRSNIINNIYMPYHKKLDITVNKLLKNNQKIIMVDCHSFSSDIIMFDNKKNNLPDICLGYNSDYNIALIEKVKTHFENAGYKVEENYPYNGSMVPNSLIKNNHKNFTSFMLEINKKIYVNNIKNFKKLKICINKLLKTLETFNI